MALDRTNLRIAAGQDVFGADGDKVGSVSGMEGDYIVVSKGFFFPTDYYIPVSAINTADDEGVYLNVTKDEALNQGWDTVPATTDSTWESQPVTDAGLNIENPVVDAGTTGYDTTSTFDDPDSVRIELAEEELTAQTRPVERGAVRVDKVVTEEQRELDVPVTEERVTVNRRVVDRDVAPGETTFEEGTIDIPVRGEEIEVEKRSRVREELEIDKEAVTETERVSGTVRREEARVSGDTGEVVDEADRTRQ